MDEIGGGGNSLAVTSAEFEQQMSRQLLLTSDEPSELKDGQSNGNGNGYHQNGNGGTVRMAENIVGTVIEKAQAELEVPRNKTPPKTAPRTVKPPSPLPQSSSLLMLRLGLVNSATSRYLTAEKMFGNRVNASGTCLKQRQTWIFEGDPSGQADIVFIRSSATGYYLSVNEASKPCKLVCENQTRDKSSAFYVEFEQVSGKWTIRSCLTSGYLAAKLDSGRRGSQPPKSPFKVGDEEDVIIRDTEIDRSPPGDAEQWLPHLAVSPMVCLRNLGRNRFAHLNEPEGNAFICNQLVPWGESALILLEYAENGKYAIRAAKSKTYLQRDGQLVPILSEKTLFSLEFKCSGNPALTGIAFRDSSEKSCLCQAGIGVLRNSTRKTITKDELFHVSDSHLQGTILCAANRKMVSTRQGVDVNVMADAARHGSDEIDGQICDTEVFQFELLRSDSSSAPPRTAIRTSKNKLWTIGAGGHLQPGVASGISASSESLSHEAIFTLHWYHNGSFALQAANGLFVRANPTGCLQAVAERISSDRERFIIGRLTNRPFIYLKGSFGFLGLSSNGSRLDCGKAIYESIFLQPLDEFRPGSQPGLYYVRATNDKYWRVVNGTIAIDAADPPSASLFHFELRRQNCGVAIRHHDDSSETGSYVFGEQCGTVKVGPLNIGTPGKSPVPLNGVESIADASIPDAALWEM